MYYFLVTNNDDGGAFIERFDDFESRRFATCKAIYGDTEKGSLHSFDNYEMSSLNEHGIVYFEGDPSILWLKGEELEIKAR